jgi:nucleoside-diphosphate-sugar epimerase
MPKETQMRIAVTGGNGDLARVLIPMLIQAGHSVVSIDRALPAPTPGNPLGSRALVVDVTDFGQVVAAMQGCDGVIHLAAHRTPMNAPAPKVFADNTQGSYNVLLAAEILGMSHVCMASSINAIGGVFSKSPRYDYLPLDEQHPCYAEDPYSLSKWVLEIQGDTFARRRDNVAISSMRFHGIVPREFALKNWDNTEPGIKHLWAYVHPQAAARACMAAMQVEWRGHEVFYIVAPTAASIADSASLAAQYYPNAERRPQLTGNAGFFDCSKAERLLGWRHDEE